MSGLNSINTFSSANIGMSSYQSIQSENELNEFSSVLDDAIASKDDEKLMDSCKQFEAYFVQQMYKAMQSTVDKSNSLFQESQATKIFNDFLVEEQSKAITDGGGIGIADMMYDSMKAQQDALEDPINQDL